MAGKDLELALRIKADLAQGQKAMEDLGRSVVGVGEAVQQTNTDLGGTGRVIDQLSAESSAAAAAVTAVETALQEVAQEARDASGQVGATAAAVDQLATESAAGAAAIEAIEVALENAAQGAQQASSQLNVATGAVDQLGSQSAAAATGIRNVGSAASTAAGGLKQGTTAVQDQTRELAELLGQIDPVIRELDRLDDMERRLRDFRNAGMLDAEDFDLYNTKLQENRVRVAATTETMRVAGLTAGQYQQALRQLPMQLTDVTTSLASGMPVWMVAIQQGGQIRDSFGGAGNAARAVVGSINPLTAAIAAVTAATIGLVAANEAGANEQLRFNEALILTGNYAGVTAGQLAAVAREMDALAGVTQSSASAALTEVAGSGKFAGEQILLVATAAEQMRVATGQAVSETVAEFERLATDPIAAILKLNETQHFLTEAQLEQIRTLRDQQGQQAAATEAMRVYAAVIADRTPQVNENLGSIERAWRNIKDVARETADGLLSIGRAPDDAQRMAELTQRIAYLKSTVGTGFEPLADTQGEIARLSAELDSLTAKQKAAADATKSTVDSAAETARQAVADSFVKGAEAQVQSLQKLSNVQRAHAVMQEQGITATSTLGRRMLEAAEAADQQKAATDAATEAERQAEKARRKSEQQLEAAGRKAEQAAKQQLNYVQGLEKQAATIGMSSAQVREYELAERSLTGALHERAAAALALIDAEERKRQADADGKQLAGLQAQLLAAQGQTAAATTLQLEQQYGELLQRLKERGDQAGVDLVNSLINAEQAKAQLSELQAQIDAVFAEQARREQTINTQQQAGLISELGARQQILDLNRQAADQVEKLLPKMRELAAATGDQASIERLKDLELRLANLRTVADEFSNALKAGFENGIQSALEGLATGTMDLQEAAISFVRGIASAMADLAAQQLAQMATSSIMGMFGGGADSGAGLTAGAAAVTTSAGALSAAGGTLLSGAAAIELAAASLAAANGVKGATGGGSSEADWLSSVFSMFGGGGSSSAAGASAGGYTGAFGFSDGGHVLGAGTTTSDSIPAWLSNYEFVTRAAVVQQPGALDFLHEFNARGMAALANWAPRVHHATGGLAGVPAPALPAPTLGGARLAEPAAAMSTTLKNNVNLYAVQDASQVAAMAWSKPGQEHFLVYLQQNGSTIKQALGIG